MVSVVGAQTLTAFSKRLGGAWGSMNLDRNARALPTVVWTDNKRHEKAKTHRAKNTTAVLEFTLQGEGAECIIPYGHTLANARA